MYLKSLELQGFKSFADKTVLQFGRDITAIVGPNGSGKSNISDAIRWVMGEQSTRELRGAKMEDIIFGGTQMRKPLGFAEASLILDNADGEFPLETKEIMITRRYYRSGESEFYINKQSARLRDVHELLMDTGLGKEGYANISQGRIDEILSMKSTDRREIFEEAAGISKYRHRKEETERKLKATDENLIRIGDKISELEMQVEPLRVQAEKARQYLAWHDELKGVEVAVWLENLERLSLVRKKAEADYNSASFILEQEHALLDELYRKAEKLSETLREFDARIDLKRLQINEEEGQFQKLNGEKNLLLASIEHNTANAERVKQELAEQESRENSLAGQIAKSEQRVQELRKQTLELSIQLSELEQLADSLSDSNTGFTREYLALQKRLTDTKSQLAKRTVEADSAEAAAQEASERCETVAGELQDARQKYQLLQMQEAQCCADLQNAKDAVVAAKNIISGYQIRLKSRENRREALQQELNQRKVQRDTLASRIHLLEEMERDFEGYSKAVKIIMQEHERGNLKNVHGPVSKLIRTEEAYSVAIETALGAAVQHIVVSTEQDGKAAIQLLKRRDGGRATFLPLNVIRGKLLREDGLPQTTGFVGIAADLVSCRDCYREIILNLLGRTVIAENLDTAVPMARKFGNRFRIVTLDGQVINAGGSMTGGSVSRSAGILSRSNELDKLRNRQLQCNEDFDSLRKNLQDAVRAAEEVQYALTTAAGELREAEDNVLRLEGELRHCDAMLQTMKNVIASDTREQETADNRMQEALQIAAEKRMQATLLETQIAELTEELDVLELSRTDAAEQIQQIRAEMQKKQLERAAAEAEQESVCQNIRQLRTLSGQMQGDNSRKEQLLLRYARENAATREKIAVLEQRQNDTNHSVAQLKTELVALTRDRMSTEAEKTIVARSAQDKNRDILNMERESARLEQKKLSAEMEEKQNIDKLWDSYGLTPSTAAGEKSRIDSIPQAQRKIAELKRKIGSLGTPNLGAIEEFDRVHERYEYLTNQRDDVMTSKRDLEDIIRSITREMTTIFTTEFVKINRYFGETFAEMFGGGKGSLELEDPEHPLECGIEIRVQPPGKQLKTIMLLSGGEKAFVAIALYFAILKVRPTPFCMLDEIDAALDDRNVERFASYLRSLSKMTQFIVVTHRRGTMEEADTLFGVTMQEQGVSRIVHLDLNRMVVQLGITE